MTWQFCAIVGSRVCPFPSSRRLAQAHHIGLSGIQDLRLCLDTYLDMASTTTLPFSLRALEVSGGVGSNIWSSLLESSPSLTRLEVDYPQVSSVSDTLLANPNLLCTFRHLKFGDPGPKEFDIISKCASLVSLELEVVFLDILEGILPLLRPTFAELSVKLGGSREPHFSLLSEAVGKENLGGLRKLELPSVLRTEAEMTDEGKALIERCAECRVALVWSDRMR